MITEADKQAPTLDIIPRFGVNRKIDETILLNFDEVVVAGSGSIIISNGTDTRVIDINDTSQVSFGWSKVGGDGGVFINPTDNLIPDTRYHIQIPDGVIQDTAGNAFEGVDDPDIFNFTAIKSNPLLNFTFPSSESPLKIDEPIQLVFDEAMAAGNGVVVISNGVDMRVIDVRDTSQVIIGPYNNHPHSVIIDPVADLIPDTNYSLWMNTGAFTDLAGNAFEGPTVSQALDFKTISSNPKLTGFNIFDEFNLGGLKAGSDIELRFDETVIAGKGTITISNGEDTRTIDVRDHSQVIFDGNDNVIINPAEDLLPDTRYTIQITPGAIIDLTNNAYVVPQNPAAFSFVTLPEYPILQRSIPFNGSETFQIDNTISLFFNETVLPGNGAIIIGNDFETRVIDVHDASQITFDGNNVSINPKTDLQPNMNYHILIDSGAIIDVDGRSYEGINDSSVLGFTTIPTEPALLLSEPLGNIKADEGVSVVFNENILPGNGVVTISNGMDTRSIDIHDANQVIIDEFSHKIVINPINDWIAGTTYYIQIPGGAIIDTAGNAFGGVNNPDTLRFSAIESGPLLVKVINVLDPAFVGDALLKIDDDIELLFDEDIIPGSGSIIISNGTDTRIIDIHDTSQVTFSASKALIINPINDLIPNTNYSVQITAGAITDSEGNAFIEISGMETFDFMAINSGPILAYNSASDSAAGLPFDSDILLTFDEDITPGNGSVVISNGSDKRIIDIQDSDQISIVNTQLVINPLHDLLPDTNYDIQIVPGAITDTAGNPYEGDFDLVVLNFTTAGFSSESVIF